MDEKTAKILREPFKPELVGKLPKPTKRDNPKGRCSECGGYHGLPAVHLDYVGHAAITDRLLQADPEWTYEFLAANQDGSPVVFTDGLTDPTAQVGIWIALTVGGVTRPGFGDGKNFKEAIGDALRNAAMRFGVGLDLWSKEDLNGDHDDEPAKPKPRAKSKPGDKVTDTQLAQLRTLVAAASKAQKKSATDIVKALEADAGSPMGELSQAQADEIAAKLAKWTENGAQVAA
jgi:hypothetical protein